MTTWVYVDETKRAGYVLAAVTVADPAPTRQVVRSLIVPGRRRLHMHNEHARRRRLIVSTLASSQIKARVYDAARRYPTDIADIAARSACLGALVEDLAAIGGPTVVAAAGRPDPERRPPARALKREARAPPPSGRGLGLTSRG